jgi:hypothetical protein
MTQPVIDTVGVPVVESSTINQGPQQPATPTNTATHPTTHPPVQQLSAGDIIAKIRSILMEEHELTAEQISRIEQFGSVQIGDQKWETGGAPGGNAALVILAMYRGEANEQVADQMQGDVRVYAVPVGVVRPGEKAYRRLTVNPVMQKLLIDRMTYDRFVEAVAYEDFSIAVESQIVVLDEEDEDETEEPS